MKYTGRDRFKTVEIALNRYCDERSIFNKTLECYEEIEKRVEILIKLGNSPLNAINLVLNNVNLMDSEKGYPQLRNPLVRAKLKELLYAYCKRKGYSLARTPRQHDDGGHDER